MTVSQVNSTSNYIGLSTDTKPRVEVGSTFYETDTGSRFIIDTIGEWHATQSHALAAGYNEQVLAGFSAITEALERLILAVEEITN